MRRETCWFLAGAALALLGGCGEPTPRVGTLYPIKGKVTSPDGKPLPKVNVCFSGPVSNQFGTGDDGTFASGENSGLPAGDYKVRLEAQEMKGTARRPIHQFPDKYLDEDSSGLKATVQADGSNDFNFALTRGEAQVGSPVRRGSGPAKVRD